MTDAPDTTVAPVTPAASTPAPAWIDTLTPESQAIARVKGWDSADKAIAGYGHLEKLARGDEKTLLRLPGANATPEERAAFSRQLGVPDKPDGYEIKLPENFTDPEFGKTLAPLLHEFGIPKASGEAFAAKAATVIQQAQAAQIQAENAEFAAAETALKSKWSDKFDQNVEIAKRAAKTFGVSDIVIDQMETKAGFAGVMEFLYHVGLKTGEGAFIDGGAGGPSASADTHDSLMAERNRLYGDPAWAKRYHANEPTARNEAKALNAKIDAMRAKMQGT